MHKNVHTFMTKYLCTGGEMHIINHFANLFLSFININNHGILYTCMTMIAICLFLSGINADAEYA